MNALHTARLLGAFAGGSLLMTVAYAVQTALGAGLWLVLGGLALLTLAILTLALSFWRNIR